MFQTAIPSYFTNKHDQTVHSWVSTVHMYQYHCLGNAKQMRWKTVPGSLTRVAGGVVVSQRQGTSSSCVSGPVVYDVA